MAQDELTINETTKLSDLTDRQILELTQGIKDQESNSRPLVAKLESLDTLKQEYENDSATTFVKKIRWLKAQKWTSFRRLRGDGNCFYRAFGYGLCERLLAPEGISILDAISNQATSSDAAPTAQQVQPRAQATLERFEALLPLLDQAGYEKSIYEDFWEPLQTVFKAIACGKMTKVEELVVAFNDQETSANTIVFLRLLTSAYLKAHENDFAPFLLSFEEDYQRFPNGAPSLVDFCQFYVEAVDKDADHLSITALTRCLNVDFSIAYLDLSTGHSGHGDAPESQDLDHLPVDFHRFESQNADGKDLWSNVALLYRPGHYDLIYQEA